MKSESASYKAAGVDITAGYKAVELMKRHVARTMTAGVLDGIGGFDPACGSWRAYITAAARNAALNRARAARAAEALPDGPAAQPGPEEAVIAAEEIDELRRAIAALPPGERALIYRKYYYRQPTAQIASELGLSPRAVEGRLYRIKKRLGAALGGERNG